MRQLLIIFYLLFSFFLFAQETAKGKKSDLIFTPEIMLGITAEANENFPDRNAQFQIILNIGWDHTNNPQEWAQRLKGPKTGLSLGYSNFGNNDSIGSAITLMPFIEFNAFTIKRLKIQVGMGGSYFTKKYDPITNPNNQGITTNVTWSFRAFMHYQLISGNKIDWRMGVGYFHHSNGHTRLPNQGLNSFLVSLSAAIKNTKNQIVTKPSGKSSFTKSRNQYIAFRAGYGNNVLSTAFNDTKGVYTFSGEYGNVFNKTWKVGIGFYYRFYRQYYEYIEDNEFLVRDGNEFDYFREIAWHYATNLGLHISAEALLNHFGLSIQIGANLYKPAYQIDWRINEGWDNVPREIPDYYVLGEYNSKFKLKRILTTRMGIRYYLLNTSKEPKNNLYFGFHINTNGGQADFTDLSIGYLYNFGFKEK